MKLVVVGRALALCVWASASSLPAAAADVVKLSENVEPNVCPLGFDFVAASKSCQANSTIATIEESQCLGTALSWDGANKKCVANAKKPPKPQCGKQIANLTLKDGECVIDPKTPTSLPGDYVGDCLTITAAPSDDVFAFVPGRYLKVQSQAVKNGDTMLRVVPATRDSLFGCTSKNATYREVSARELEDAGLQRAGWAYGVLAMPFKYHLKSGGFSSGGSIGPYLGWRLDYPGMAKTVAFAATIGSVKGETRDPADKTKVIGTPELMSFAIAAGMMFDVTKAPGGKPFKIGAFIGQDRVSRDDATSYKYDRKTWVAFQIGYDFTDN